MGESDRLLTVLTREFGLIRAVAPGARKHHSKLNGRSSLFVINQLLIAKGKSLDKIIQAETLESYPGLSQSLGKLTASQYLAELVLFEALGEHSQNDLFELLSQHLSRLEQCDETAVLACLVHATFHLLVLAGIAPEVDVCCLTRQPIVPDWQDPDWRVGFSAESGGTVLPSAIAAAAPPTSTQIPSKLHPQAALLVNNRKTIVTEGTSPSYAVPPPQRGETLILLSSIELLLLQQLNQPDLIHQDGTLLQLHSHPQLHAISYHVWLSIEQVLRHYAQYHFERPIRSAALIDTCFSSPLPPQPLSPGFS